jgi:hypothetical protein
MRSHNIPCDLVCSRDGNWHRCLPNFQTGTPLSAAEGSLANDIFSLSAHHFANQCHWQRWAMFFEVWYAGRAVHSLTLRYNSYRMPTHILHICRWRAHKYNGRMFMSAYMPLRLHIPPPIQSIVPCSPLLHGLEAWEVSPMPSIHKNSCPTEEAL